MKYIAIAGRQPEISAAEIGAVFGDAKKINDKESITIDCSCALRHDSLRSERVGWR